MASVGANVLMPNCMMRKYRIHSDCSDAMGQRSFARAAVCACDACKRRTSCETLGNFLPHPVNRVPELVPLAR